MLYLKHYFYTKHITSVSEIKLNSRNVQLVAYLDRYFKVFFINFVNFRAATFNNSFYSPNRFLYHYHNVHNRKDWTIARSRVSHAFVSWCNSPRGRSSFSVFSSVWMSVCEKRDPSNKTFNMRKQKDVKSRSNFASHFLNRPRFNHPPDVKHRGQTFLVKCLFHTRHTSTWKYH